MKPAISRRDMYESVVFHMKDMGFEYVSTRRGRADDLFHIDGRGVVGRGTTTSSPVGEQHLREIHETVYLKKSKDRWVHFSYGGYTREARMFANRIGIGIALFEFHEDKRISPRSTTARSLCRRKPAERWKVHAVWAVALLVALTLLVGAVVTFPVVGWTLVAVAVLVVVGFMLSIVDPKR